MSMALLTCEEPQQLQGGIFEYISPSRLGCWLGCPLRYQLRYVYGIRSPPTPSMFLGKCCHSGLEGWYRHRQLGITLPHLEIGIVRVINRQACVVGWQIGANLIVVQENDVLLAG